jgi:serine protease Do
MLGKLRWPLATGFLLAGFAGGIYLNDKHPTVQAEAPRPAVAAPAELYSFRDIVKRVTPAVVSIDSKVKARRRQPQEDNDAPVQPRQGMDLGFGSGFIIDGKGVIVTCYHVIDGADWVDVQLPDGRKFTSQDIRGDKKTDLAVIRVQPDKALPFLQLADSDQMEVGDRVLAVGAPFGLAGSVTHGIVSAKSRNLRLNQYEDFLQTDAPINPGNSGGPLINLEGKVIGVNSAIKSRSGGFQGVGLAISSNLIRSVVDQLLKDGTVRRGYIGVSIRDVKNLDADVLDKLGFKGTEGVVVARVFKDSPAKKGGLKPGDVVLSIGGRPVRDGSELSKVVAAMPLNQSVPVDLVRNGQKMELKLTVEEQPEDFGFKAPGSDDE